MVVFAACVFAWADQDGELQHFSKPVFNPDSFKEKPKLVDPFFSKLGEKRNDFVQKELKRRREFHEKIRSKDWSAEKRQKKLADFHQDETKRMQDFMAGQQKKIDKYSRKKIKEESKKQNKKKD